MSEQFQIKESKQSFQEFLQSHLNENQERTLTSPTQEIDYSSIKQLGIKKTIKREESEPSFRILEAPNDNSDKSLQSMQSKIQLLITENSKLIEINSGLMREIEIMKQNNQSNRSLIAQESQQKLMSYQNKVVQLTQANEQLSSRLMDEQNKNKKEIKDNESKIHQVLQENNNLNEMLQVRLNDIDLLNNQLVEKNNEVVLLNEEIRALNEKCMILEQQKQVLFAQQTHCVEGFKDLQIKEQQLHKQIINDQTSYQSCVANLESNYNLQITELRNSFLKEIEQQQNALAQQYQIYFNQQIIAYQQQLKQIQLENIQIKEELNERSKIWTQEKERLENIIQQQLQLQKQKQQFTEITHVQQCQPQQLINQQKNIQENQIQSEQIQQENNLLDQQKKNYQEIQQIQQQFQQQQQHQQSNYTFRQNTQEDSREISPDPDESFQKTKKFCRLHTENYNDNYENYSRQRPPLMPSNYKVPALNTLTRYNQGQKPQTQIACYNYIQGKMLNQTYQQTSQQLIINRDITNQRSYSQYQNNKEIAEEQNSKYQVNNGSTQSYLLPRRF